jgi:CRP-like cAMP-binding protein
VNNFAVQSHPHHVVTHSASHGAYTGAMRLRKRRLGTLGPGTIFGEMSLLDQGKRSADVEVKEDLTCYKITIGHLEELREEHPGVALLILDTLSKVLVARVRQLTDTVAELER